MSSATGVKDISDAHALHGLRCLFVCAEDIGVAEEEGISTGPAPVMEYTAQLLAVMQDQAEARGGVATLGQSVCAELCHCTELG